MISDSELGYSVLYCSIERYCNPDKELGKYYMLPAASTTVHSRNATNSCRVMLLLGLVAFFTSDLTFCSQIAV